MPDNQRNLVLLGISALGTILVLRYCNYLINRLVKKRVTDKKKMNKIDVLHKNHLLTFGLSSFQCDGHMNREFDCGNLDCNYGRLSHILGLINNCQQNLDVCIYIITAKLFGDCIIKAYQRGIRVRVIADSDMSFSAQSLINNFRALDIPTRQRMSPFIMHHKFVIVDNEILINGSMNFTMTGAFCNWENVMITTEPDLVDSFQAAFNNLWDDFAPANYFPPEDIVRPHVPDHQAANL